MNDDLLLKLLEEIEALREEVKKREPEPLVLGTKELAQAMGMSVNYAGKLMADPKFPSMKLGGNWKVSRRALEEWLDRNKWHELEL